MAKNKATTINKNELQLQQGMELVKNHPLFGNLSGWLYPQNKQRLNQCAAIVTRQKSIYLNKDINLSPSEWAYTIAHCQLHLSFGHFDADKMPGYEISNPDGSFTHKVTVNKALWNLACDIYIAKFLTDIKFGKPICKDPSHDFPIALNNEKHIYNYLLEQGFSENSQEYGTATAKTMDMKGLENPLTYPKGEENEDIIRFAKALSYSVCHTIQKVSGQKISDIDARQTPSIKAAQWFINHYPLLGALASSFTIIEDCNICQKNEIQIAAIDTFLGEIYINPAAGLNSEELKFVLAHEFLHAGLGHQERLKGRDPYLWNIACDYVINGWLVEMQVGVMPNCGLLYDETLNNLSAESIYDQIVRDLKKFAKLDTFRGYGKGDILDSPYHSSRLNKNAVNLDEFYKSALAQGLEYHQSMGRGFLPAGLIEEIRTLSMPPIPWDVKLARWFDIFFPPLERQRSYARPSRRQSSTPDIPRPSYVFQNLPESSRTFGVVVDTSSSMSARQLGMALGSIASYAASRDVPFARVVFCDARAYDAGYLSPDDIAGRFEVKGRGGTVLQPGVDLLEKSNNFPKDGPILIITDGMIEENLTIHHAHAFLIPSGSRLPFRPKGEVFYFSEKP